jgi:hypothetical protein
MTSLTRENTAARNRRDMHEQRINAASHPLRRLAQSWAWLYAEARRWSDDDIERLVRRNVRAARWLNGRRRR